MAKSNVSSIPPIGGSEACEHGMLPTDAARTKGSLRGEDISHRVSDPCGYSWIPRIKAKQERED